MNKLDLFPAVSNRKERKSKLRQQVRVESHSDEAERSLAMQSRGRCEMRSRELQRGQARVSEVTILVKTQTLNENLSPERLLEADAT